MKSIAGKYGFASGSGGWGTTMTVASDGTFSGTYHDSDMGITGDDYPNGSVTISNFKGRFKDAKKNADGSYTMQCDKSALKIDGNIGDTYIKNGSKYTVADPYGIAPCGAFTVYPADTTVRSSAKRSSAGAMRGMTACPQSWKRRLS